MKGISELSFFVSFRLPWIFDESKNTGAGDAAMGRIADLAHTRTSHAGHGTPLDGRSVPKPQQSTEAPPSADAGVPSQRLAKTNMPTSL